MQRSYQFKEMQMFETMEKAKPCIKNIQGLNMAAIKPTTILICCAKPRIEPMYIVYAYTRVRDHLCGLVVRVPSYRSRGPSPILGATRFPEK
jgi:hypothetical protein